ncbi:MAG: EamA family transporter [Methanomassiliicoccales archaeon]|nr:EamA family transporter [Methanomassiliicoccales archaeon]
MSIVLVAAIWASSFVLVKMALVYTGPFTLGGIRYFLGFLLLLPGLYGCRKSLTVKALKRCALIGFFQYVFGNGALFWALRTVSATVGSLTQSFTPVVVLGLERLFLREPFPGLTSAGVLLSVGGTVAFFVLGGKTAADWPGLGLLGLSLLGFTGMPILTREAARDNTIPVLPLTALPLGIGGGALLLIGLITEGLPCLPLKGWGLLLFLAGVNTALAYFLYTQALRYITATEASVILNFSPIGTALLAAAILGERIALPQSVALVAALGGVGLALLGKRLSS